MSTVGYRIIRAPLAIKHPLLGRREKISFPIPAFNGDLIEEVGVSTPLFLSLTIEVPRNDVSDSFLSSNCIGILLWVFIPKMSLVFLNT